MIPARPRNEEKRLCRTCGEDITQHARSGGGAGTQCGPCYWKGRLEACEPLDVLLRRRNDLRHELRQVRAALDQDAEALHEHQARLKSQTPWWKRLLAIGATYDRLRELQSRTAELDQKTWELKRSVERAEDEVKIAQDVRKRFDSAAEYGARKRKREAEAEKAKQEFSKRSRDDANAEYDRDLFTIRKKDYKRGNPLDNHFRSRIMSEVLAIFGHKCLFCDSKYDLTLDHFAVLKNEGGNFILLSRDGRTIKANVVVLCRSCNSAKGELDYFSFFDATKLDQALTMQRRVLELALNDEATMKVITIWYGVRLA